MTEMDPDQKLLRSVAMQNAHSILLARQKYEDALVQARDDLEAKTEQLAKSLARRDFPSRRPSGRRLHPTAPATLRIPEPRPEPAIEATDSAVIRFPGAQQ